MKITLYSRPFCSWCDDAKEYLEGRGMEFTVIDVSQNPAANEEMIRLSGQRYVPTIVIDDKVLANFDVEQLQTFLSEIKK
jgi:glutaredoxin-like YruB-family protein